MKKIYLMLSLLFSLQVFSQTISITANPGTSANIVLGTQAYHASEYIYTDAEIGSSNFTTAGTSINRIDFTVSTLGTPTAFANVNIYMQNTANTVFTDGTYALAGYTLVYSGAVTAAAIGQFGVNLTTPFVRTSGSNLQILIERNDNTAHTGYVFASANGNNAGSTLTTSRRYNGAAAPAPGTTTLTASAFRAAIQLKRTTANDAGIMNVQTLSKLAIPSSLPHVISTVIKNEGTATKTNIPVTLTITGANSFTNTQNVASIAAGATALVTFPAYNPTVVGANSVAVSIPADDFAGNNLMTVNQATTYLQMSTAYNTTPTQGVGFNASTGELGVYFKNSSGNNVTQLTPYFNTAAQPFTVSVFSVTAGAPGTSLWTSGAQTSVIGANPVAVPNVAVSGDFFAVVSQTGTTNFGAAYETESPIRTGVFFFRTTGAWGDFAPNNTFKVMMEAQLATSLPVTFVTFTGLVQNSNTFLNWSTTNEINNAYYTVERAENPNNFSAIGTVAASTNTAGTNKYQFTDRTLSAVNSNVVYYRLKQVDKDGLTRYSNIIKVNKVGKYNFEVVVINPSKNTVQMVVSTDKAQRIDLQLLNHAGQMIASKEVDLSAGANSLSIGGTATLAKGLYMLKVVRDGEAIIKQVIVE